MNGTGMVDGIADKPRLVQSGPDDAKILLVGESPGETEDRTGRPFEGGAGELLSRMLDRCGILRSDCFITNVAHVRPKDNKFEWFFKKENQVHLLRGVLQLKRDIERIRPNLVVGLGSYPLKYLTGKEGIEKWRGSILESTLVKGQKVVCTFHPAACMRVWDLKAVSEFDFKRCKDESSLPDITLPNRAHYLHPNEHTRDLVIAQMEQAEWLAVDIECWQNPEGKWRLACVGYSDYSGRSLVIHNDGPGSLNAIRRLCACPAKKVYQNGTFDVTVLESEGIRTTNFAWDTMLAHHALFPECASSPDEVSSLSGRKRSAAIQKGLAFQASIYTREPFYKDDGKVWRQTGDLRTFWLYNGRDSAVTREIRDVQSRELDIYGTQEVFKRRMALVEPTMAATKRGIRIDLGVRDRLRKSIEEEIGRLQAFLNTTAGEAVNVKSSKQVQALIYDKLKLPVQRKRGSGSATADKDALNNLGAKYNNPVLHSILKIRERRDLIERYLSAAVDADGRMRCSWDITGTRTGRLSSRASIYGSGTNLQNIPNRRKEGEVLRRMFVADPGKVFIVRDYSQAEVWIVAYLAECERLIELLNDPTRDIHRETASGIFNKPLDAITSEERFLAKKTVHSSNYGIEGKHLASAINEDAEVTGIRITPSKANQIIAGYFMLYPEIKSVFWREIEQELRYTRTITSPLGMKRTFYGRWDDKLMRDAYAQPAQSTVGELGGMAWVNMYRDIELGAPETGTNVLLNVHDAIMAQCNVSCVASVVDRMATAMAIPVTIKGRTFTIPTDAKVGLNWGKAAEDNPNGLRDWNKGGREWLDSLKEAG